MAKEPDPARTMRIDIPPEDLPPPRHRVPLSTFVLKRHGRPLRNTPYDLLLESIYDGAIITNSRGTIIDFNRRAADFFQMPDGRLLKRHVIDLLSGANDSLIAAIWQNLESHRYTLIEARCVRADARTFPAEIAVNRLDIEDDRLLCFFIRDISVRKKVQEDLEAALERMKAMDRMRSEFVSNVSHELRTPLTSMIYAVGNLLRGIAGPLPPKATQYIERLQSDCKRLLATVNDILDLRQMEDGTLSLARARIPLEPLLRSTLETLAIQAETKGVALRASFPPHEYFAWCDPQKIERVLINVIGNAIKFTDSGGEIRVAISPCAQKPGLVCLSVEDNGMGIPSESLDKISQRYFRVGQHIVGSGLGLAISREILELHGGRLDVASPPPDQPNGTVVYIHIPQTEPPAIILYSHGGETSDFFLDRLSARGYRVIRVRTESEVESYCFSQQADLLLLDAADMADPDLLLRLRRDPRTQRLPILAITGPEGPPKLLEEIFQKISIPTLRPPWDAVEVLRKIATSFLSEVTFTSTPNPTKETPP